MRIDKKTNLIQKRRWRIRKKVQGTALRPRLSLKLTNQHIYAQCIDDEVGKTLVYLSTVSKKNKKDTDLLGPNIHGATQLGKKFGLLAKKAGIDQVVFDRSGRRYHGTVKAFAEAAREALSF